ncbi:MAG TPA: HIT family protein [Anaerolineae bacterium]|nr:HIT family protein [Anaerolineae bacterium]
MTKCYTCELILQRDKGAAPLWDNIYRTQYWDVVHSYNTGLPGWLVLVSRRHIEAIDEMSDDEVSELGILIREVSIILKQITDCLKTYVLQFAEHPKHPHVHFHIVPRMKDQPEERRGAGVMGYLGVPESERVDENVMNEMGEQIRQMLCNLEWGNKRRT